MQSTSRCVALRPSDGRVPLLPLAPAFPDVVDALAARLPVGTVVDGEVVVMSGLGLDFRRLQRRLTSRRVEPDAPATLVGSTCWLTATGTFAVCFTTSAASLEQIIHTDRTGLALMPATRDLAGAQAWMRLPVSGIEGVVAKRSDHAYRPDRHVWSKLKSVRVACVADCGSRDYSCSEDSVGWAVVCDRCRGRGDFAWCLRGCS